jgi:hypothetical protein
LKVTKHQFIYVCTVVKSRLKWTRLINCRNIIECKTKQTQLRQWINHPITNKLSHANCQGCPR